MKFNVKFICYLNLKLRVKTIPNVEPSVIYGGSILGEIYFSDFMKYNCAYSIANWIIISFTSFILIYILFTRLFRSFFKILSVIYINISFMYL